MAAEDAKRLGGELPDSFSAGKRVLLPARRAEWSAYQPVELALYDPAELLPRRWPAATGRWTPAPTHRPLRGRARALHRRRRPAGRGFQPVTGPGPVVGDEIARHPGIDGVAFIGSTATGRRVAQAAAGKAALLEMGGNGPIVVLDDADLDAAVDATLTACFLCAGQSCTAGERLLVHRAVRDEFVERSPAAVGAADPARRPVEYTTTMGPLNNEPVAAKMDGHVGDALERGAAVVAGGARGPGADRPVLAGHGPVRRARRRGVATEETFGPVAPVVADRRLEQAIELTNASPYGLLAAIFTADLGRGLQFADAVHTGWVNINESCNYWESHLPFGGRAGTDSGIGRVGRQSRHAAFTELQTIVLSSSGR